MAGYIQKHDFVLSKFHYVLLKGCCTQWRAEGGAGGAMAPGRKALEGGAGPACRGEF